MVWVAAPDRVHVEYQGTGVIPIRRRVSSVNGRRISAYEHNPIKNLLDPSGLIGVADLAIMGRGEAAGRPVCIVEALPRPQTIRPPFDGLAPGPTGTSCTSTTNVVCCCAPRLNSPAIPSPSPR